MEIVVKGADTFKKEATQTKKEMEKEKKEQDKRIARVQKEGEDLKVRSATLEETFKKTKKEVNGFLLIKGVLTLILNWILSELRSGGVINEGLA